MLSMYWGSGSTNTPNGATLQGDALSHWPFSNESYGDICCVALVGSDFALGRDDPFLKDSELLLRLSLLGFDLLLLLLRDHRGGDIFGDIDGKELHPLSSFGVGRTLPKKKRMEGNVGMGPLGDLK